MLDPANPHTWPEVKSMTLNDWVLLNTLYDARDEADAIREQRRRKRDKDKPRG